MKRLLLVDDDAMLTRAYRDWLSKHGFQVNTVGSGAGALLFLQSAKPDLVVLDLMMPEVTGVDVLKFVRGQSRLVNTPVVVLAHEPRSDLGQHAARIGIQKAFRKDQCSPSVLMGAIDEILEPKALAAAKQSEPVADPVEWRIECRMGRPAEPVLECGIQNSECGMEMTQDVTKESRAEAKAGLLADAPAICADLSELLEALARESLTGPEHQEHLQDLFFKIRFLLETANLTGLAALAQATAVFNALLSVLMENPQRLRSSTLRAVAGLVEVVRLLFQQARESGGDTPISARVLVVDDDPAASERVVAALRGAQLDACSAADSLAAWQWINSEQFNLVLLRMEMPVLNGLQLCERLRKVQGYEKTPVIFVAQDNLDNRARCASVGGDDLIAKSILPQELVAWVVGHLVGTRMQA
jgi:DNA-binding response OmpR family regulator